MLKRDLIDAQVWTPLIIFLSEWDEIMQMNYIRVWRGFIP